MDQTAHAELGGLSLLVWIMFDKQLWDSEWGQ